MCNQCLAETKMIGEVVPDFFLVQATKNVSGLHIKNGNWGIVVCNDPEFWYSGCWERNPYDGLTDEQINNLPDCINDDDYIHAATLLNEEVSSQCNPTQIYDLITACTKVGYDREQHNDWGFWFMNYVGKYLENIKNA